MNSIKKRIAKLVSFLAPTIVAVVIVSLLFLFILGLVYIPTSSMANTIPQNTLTLMLRSRFLFDGLRRGDIIVFQPSLDNSNPENISSGIKDDKLPLLTKRIVGLPGDVIEIKEGKTYINGQMYVESWLAEEPEALDFGPYEVGEGQLFVMGDNRNHSEDSRYWENPFVREDAVIGRIFFIMK